MANEPKVAAEVELVLGNPNRLFIDGQEFPWHVTSDDLEIIQDAGQVPILRVGILVERALVRWAAPGEFDGLSEAPSQTPEEETEAPPVPLGAIFPPSVGDTYQVRYEYPPHDDIQVMREHTNRDGEPVDSSIPYVVRVDGKWMWAEDVEGRVHMEPWSWEDFAEAWRGSTFEVVRVKADD